MGITHAAVWQRGTNSIRDSAGRFLRQMIADKTTKAIIIVHATEIHL